jgi:hypothetical protein
MAWAQLTHWALDIAAPELPVAVAGANCANICASVERWAVAVSWSATSARPRPSSAAENHKSRTPPKARVSSAPSCGSAAAGGSGSGTTSVAVCCGSASTSGAAADWGSGCGCKIGGGCATSLPPSPPPPPSALVLAPQPIAAPHSRSSSQPAVAAASGTLQPEHCSARSGLMADRKPRSRRFGWLLIIDLALVEQLTTPTPTPHGPRPAAPASHASQPGSRQDPAQCQHQAAARPPPGRRPRAWPASITPHAAWRHDAPHLGPAAGSAAARLRGAWYECGHRRCSSARGRGPAAAR